MSKRTYFAERGDLVHLEFSPSTGNEMAGGHYGLVLSTASFAKATSHVLVCPITSTIRGWGFEVPIPKGILPPKKGAEVGSVILTHQVKSLDYRERSIEFVARVPDAILDEVLELVRAILDSDDVMNELPL